MKLYIDGEKAKTVKSGEGMDRVTEETLDPPGVHFDTHGKGSFKAVKIYVDGTKKLISETAEKGGAVSESKLASYGSGGFRSVASDGVQDRNGSTVYEKTPSRTAPEPVPFQSPKAEKEHKIPTSPDVASNAGKNGKPDVKKLTTIAVLLVAVCVCVIIFAFNSGHNNVPEKAFSDDPAAISAAAESVVIISVYDYFGELIGIGSGFACFENDLIVTNYHVIENAAYIQATTENGQVYDILRSDDYKLMDLAILTTEVPHNLKLLQPRDSDGLKKGEKVIAIGSPQGFINTASDGIFSAYYDVYLQFTAPISPGSSGGALFNDAGEVVGIPTWQIVEGQNMNFAVPIEYAVQLYNEWIK